MMKKEKKMSDFGFWIFLTVLIVLFYGTPDIHDMILGKIE